MRGVREVILPGRQFGCRTVIKETGTVRFPCGGVQRTFLCRCVCGWEDILHIASLRRGSRCIKCYALDRPVKHGMTGSPEFKVWIYLRARCRQDAKYKALGVWPEWDRDFMSFFRHVGPMPSLEHTIDRKRNNLGYVPGNVRWATMTEQARNKSTNHVLRFEGKSLTMAEWSEVTGIRAGTIHERVVKLGWTVRRALTEAVNIKFRPQKEN